MSADDCSDADACADTLPAPKSAESDAMATIAQCINVFGDGQHPCVEENDGLRFFEVAYQAHCVERARIATQQRAIDDTKRSMLLAKLDEADVYLQQLDSASVYRA